MEFGNLFSKKKNIMLMVAIASILIGAVTFILAMPFAFGPWITPSTAEEPDSHIAFIAFIGLLISLAEIILGVIICTPKFREKLSLIIPLLSIMSSVFLLIIISLVIFGFVEISAFFYIVGILLTLAALAGLIYTFFLKELSPEEAMVTRERKAKEAAEARAAKSDAKAAKEMMEKEERMAKLAAAAEEKAAKAAAPKPMPAPMAPPPFMTAMPADTVSTPPAPPMPPKEI